MSPELILFLLRVVSALALLAFAGIIGWLIYRDIKLLTEIQTDGLDQQGELQIIDGTPDLSEKANSFPLYPVTSIGRAVSNTIVLDHDFVSGRHALITLRGTQWWLEDLGSRNGTQLNDFPLEVASVVKSGDIISIGPIKMRIAV